MEMAGVVIGVLIGGVLSLLTIGFAISNGKKREAKGKDERDQVIRSIAEELVEIDKLNTSHNTGRINDASFKSSLAAHIESINKNFKPNLHVLDVYYVKYIEELLEQYGKTAFGSGAAKGNLVSMEISQPSEEAIAEIEESKTNEANDSESIAEVEPVYEATEAVVEEKVDQIPEIHLDSNGEMEFPEKGKEADKSESTSDQEQEVKEVVQDKVSTVDEPQETSEEVFEAVPEKKESTTEEQDVASFEEEFAEIANEVDSGKKGTHSNAKSEEPAQIEEDFALETIMDIDVNRLQRSKPEDISYKFDNLKQKDKKPSKEPEKSDESEELEVAFEKKPADQSESIEEAFGKSQGSADSNEENIVPPTIFEYDTANDQVIVPEGRHDDKKDEHITGDDVADKIDSFFGFKR